MGELGDILRRAREDRGLSLEQVEQATKIRATYLEALEQEDFGRMPGPVYARGFLRNYARFLGLDEQDVLALYQPSRVSTAPSVPSPMLDEPLSPPSLRNWLPLAVGLLVVASVAIGWWAYPRYLSGISFGRPGPTATPTLAPTATDLVPAPTATREAPVVTVTRTLRPTFTATPSPTRVGVEVGVRIVGSRSWLLVVADGERVFAGILEPGAEESWSARERISLRSGNAGAVELTLNGQEMGLFGEVGDVVEMEWTAVGVPTRTPTSTPGT